MTGVREDFREILRLVRPGARVLDVAAAAANCSNCWPARNRPTAGVSRSARRASLPAWPAVWP